LEKTVWTLFWWCFTVVDMVADPATPDTPASSLTIFSIALEDGELDPIFLFSMLYNRKIIHSLCLDDLSR